MVREHHVRLEGDFVNVVISILLLEGIGRSLNPDLDLFKRSAIFVPILLHVFLLSEELASPWIVTNAFPSALPILRKLGSGTTFLKSVRAGDTSMLRAWVGLEARTFLQTSVENVEMCVKYDLLSPNIWWMTMQRTKTKNTFSLFLKGDERKREKTSSWCLVILLFVSIISFSHYPRITDILPIRVSVVYRTWRETCNDIYLLLL